MWGRISDPIYLDGKQPVAPSAIAAKGHVSLIRPVKPFVTPRAPGAGRDSGNRGRISPRRRKREGGGLRWRGAARREWLLLDQFLQDSTNKRTDIYGGPIENRARLMFEALDAAISVWGADRVGLHLAPRGDSNSMGDSNPAKTFGYVASEAGKRKIAFICARESLDEPRQGPAMKKAFGGVFIANQKLTKETGSQLLAKGEADAIAYGQLFIANPDLPLRFAKDGPLNMPDPETFYAMGPQGYTDYPFWKG